MQEMQNKIKVVEKVPGRIWDIRYPVEAEVQHNKKHGFFSRLISLILS
ncbi:MAG: hypothetical protein ACP5NE_02785 [Candidatus Micrarchaeia archaeon]